MDQSYGTLNPSGRQARRGPRYLSSLSPAVEALDDGLPSAPERGVMRLDGHRAPRGIADAIDDDSALLSHHRRPKASTCG